MYIYTHAYIYRYKYECIYIYIYICAYAGIVRTKTYAVWYTSKYSSCSCYSSLSKPMEEAGAEACRPLRCSIKVRGRPPELLQNISGTCMQMSTNILVFGNVILYCTILYYDVFRDNTTFAVHLLSLSSASTHGLVGVEPFGACLANDCSVVRLWQTFTALVGTKLLTAFFLANGRTLSSDKSTAFPPRAHERTLTRLRTGGFTDVLLHPVSRSWGQHLRFTDVLQGSKFGRVLQQ